MAWNVWEDPHSENRDVYAMFSSDLEGSGYNRLYKLGSAGRVEEISSPTLGEDAGPPDLVTELGELSKPAGLRVGNRAIQIENKVYAFAGGVLFCYAEDVWQPVARDCWPNRLVLLADETLGLLHPSLLK